MSETRSHHSKSFSEGSGRRSHVSTPLLRTRSVAGPRPLPPIPSKSTSHFSQQYRNVGEPSNFPAPDPIIYHASNQSFPPIVAPKPQKFLPIVQSEFQNVIEPQYQNIDEYESRQISGTQSWYAGDESKWSIAQNQNPDSTIYGQPAFPSSPHKSAQSSSDNYNFENTYIPPQHSPYIQNDQPVHYESNADFTNRPIYESQDQGYPIQELINDIQAIAIQQQAPQNLPKHTDRSVLPPIPIKENKTQYQKKPDQTESNSWSSSNQLTLDDNGVQQYAMIPEHSDLELSTIQQTLNSSRNSLGPDGAPIPISLSGGNRGSWFASGGNRTPTPDRNSKMPTLKLLIDEKIARRRTATSKTLALDENALQTYREAAKKTNDPSIQMDYAKFLMQMAEMAEAPNNGSETNNKLEEEAIYWINQLAKNNYSEALYFKGTWYEYGTHGKEKNEEKAFKLYLSSSKQGFSKAKRKVAEYHEKDKDYKRALQFYKKAASLGDIVATNRLALVYMHGELKQDIDFKQALIYLKQAASKANEECPDGAYIYGMILAREYSKVEVPDDLVVPDDYEAKELILRAANLGHAAALFKMGSCYEYAALGCPFDPLLSIQYYRRASEKGYTEADMSLCKWYLCGCEGYFEQNEELAYEYAERAAAKGLPVAEFAMGYFYEVGIHVPIDPSTANTWYTKAAEHGNKDAIERLTKGGTLTRTDHEQNKLIKLNEKEEKGKECVIQ
ncbi:13177_t:CDS:2 [Acaulospora colombiana]|uniref:13177_t:CDS:1 n=1 Tax=Acaulospora colombiana TaxID=27376 RepID=A0ACA9MQ73_9GLOM|nr:13177_t:CDS:2 [Acaulospora colombiana]